MSNQQYLSTDVDPDNASRAELVAERWALRDLRTIMIAFLTGPTAPAEQTLQTAFDLFDGRLARALESARAADIMTEPGGGLANNNPA